MSNRPNGKIMNTNGFTFIDLFAGIGGIRIAFERNGGKCVYSSEWDRHAQEVYEANFGEKPDGDITKVDENSIPDHDILTAGFPCQPFSIIGKKNGFADTRGTLFFDIERILAAKKPYAFLLENVKMLKNHDGGRTYKVIRDKLENLGYCVHNKVLNSLDFGMPQKRERIFIIGFRKNHPFKFPTGLDQRRTSLEELLEDNLKVDKKHFVSQRILKSRMERVGYMPNHRTIWHENKSGNIGVHKFSCALRAGASYNYLLVDGKRRLTPRENLRLMGFPDGFKIVVPNAQVRKQAGNSVVIPVVQAVAKEMLKAISLKPMIKYPHRQGQLFENKKYESAISDRDLRQDNQKITYSPV